MNLEDVDIVLEHSSGAIRLSELTEEDLKEIHGLADYIHKSGLFKDPYQSVIAAFHLYADSFIDSNLWAEIGKNHH